MWAALLMGLLVAAPARGLSGETGRSALKVYTDRDGLPQNSVEAVTFDQEGYLWLGTQDGAVRYDGREWETLSMPRPTITNWVGAMLAASDGALWFGTRGDGVHRYRDGTWTSFGTAEGFPDGHVLALAETLDGGRSTIWAGTLDHGLFRITESGASPVPPPAGHPFSSVLALEVTRNERPGLWVGTEKGLLRYESLQWQDGDGRKLGLPAVQVLSVLETRGPDREPTLWVGTERGLAVRRAGRWRTYDTTSGLPNAYVYRLAQTTNLRGEPVVWIGTEGGVGRLEGDQWRFLDMDGGLPSNVIRALRAAQNSAGRTTLWIGSFGGLVRLTEGGWRSYTHESGLSENAVFSIQELMPGDLWFGTLGGGLSRLHDGRWSYVRTYRDRPIPAVMSFLRATGPGGRQELWVGTRGSGLLRFDGSSWSEILPPEGLPDTWIYALLETRGSDGRPVRWIGTRKGLVRLDAAGRRVYAQAEGLPHDHVVALLGSRDAAGRPTLWVGTRGGGVACLDLGTDRFTVHDPTTGMEGLRVGSLSETRAPDGRRQLWVTSNGSGVWRLDLDRPGGTWVQFSEKTRPALPNDLVYQMQSDRQGRLYFFTRRGVARFARRQATAEDPAEYSAFTYTSGDGLPSDGCTQGSSFVDQQGRIWTGTVAGAAVLDPEQEREDRVPKPLYLESARVLGSGRRVSEGAVLRHGENRLSFRYALLSYYREADTRYRVQLEGLDPSPSDWIADGRKEYTTLPAGRYVLRVRGRDYAGNESGPISLSFEIRPAPWRTAGAYVAYAALALLLGGLVFRLRLRALRARTAELEARVGERTQELEVANRALQEQSLTDPLTGVKNRRFVAVTVPQDVAQVVRAYRERTLGRRPDPDLNLDLMFFVVDIDHFKSVNDSHGHLAGDCMLQETVERLKTVTRRTDTVVRWGGEEFLIIARQTNRHEAPAIAERIRAIVAGQPFDLPGARVTRTCCVGFAAFPFVPEDPEAVSWEQVVHLADHALYAAKRSGRNAWVGLEAAAGVDPGLLGSAPALRIQELVADGSLDVRASLPPGAAVAWSAPARE